MFGVGYGGTPNCGIMFDEANDIPGFGPMKGDVGGTGPVGNPENDGCGAGAGKPYPELLDGAG